MDSQNETAQLRYLEETSIRLRRMDFETMPAEDQQLPVKWNGSDLCRISGKGSVLYRQERVDALGAQDTLQAVIDTAKMTSEYMAILETAPRLKATDLTGDYRILADFGDAVLAGHPTLISLSWCSVPVRLAAAEHPWAAVRRPAPSTPPVPDPVQTKGFHPVYGQTLAHGRSPQAAPAQKGRLLEQARCAR